MNPIQDGRDRTILDRMLRDVSASGVFVSTHPDVILKMGTKEVLYHTRHLDWGCDTHLYRSMAQMRRELPRRLATGRARVLKQYRGNGGNGVWKVQAGTKYRYRSPSINAPFICRSISIGSYKKVTVYCNSC
jgi:glutathione synthase/RimK-type ligase-like ATP-grasp enzyme